MSSLDGWTAYEYCSSMGAAVLFVILRRHAAATLLLVAPALFAASIYMELRRVIILVKGAAIMVTRTSASGGGNFAKSGQNVIIGGLVVRIVFFGFSLISALDFQRRLTSHPTAEGGAAHTPKRKTLHALHTSSILVLVRSVVRVVEYIEGTDGFLMSNEVFIYVFDGLLVFVLMVIFVVIHPSEVNCLLGRGEIMTMKGGLSVSEGSMLV
ncbi:RTA-like protein [Penicillium cinerascens]|uniref:RTA-like protein n=1 Tax=Penicillium cinerascens TaxID=70096 RepID=A0A9W9MHR3_9EURO|nr:RTA-like protein [Penicillium cinerascens]KAJ5201504.1 RTA-like protein [Penicillium cinerascens]